jgi:tetratricopeptide (TPR) repeat protein
MPTRKLLFAFITGLASIVSLENATAGNWDTCPRAETGQEAIAACSAIIKAGRETKKNLAIAYSNRGSAYYHTGQIDLAVADYTEALKLNSRAPMAYQGRAAAYFYQGKYDLALPDFDRWELSPKSADAFYSRSTAHQKKGNVAKALADLDKAIRLKPKMVNAYFNRGIIYQDQHNWLAALTNFEKVIALDPNDLEARRRIEEVRKQLN